MRITDAALRRARHGRFLPLRLPPPSPTVTGTDREKLISERGKPGLSEACRRSFPCVSFLLALSPSPQPIQDQARLEVPQPLTMRGGTLLGDIYHLRNQSDWSRLTRRRLDRVEFGSGRESIIRGSMRMCAVNFDGRRSVRGHLEDIRCA